MTLLLKWLLRLLHHKNLNFEVLKKPGFLKTPVFLYLFVFNV